MENCADNPVQFADYCGKIRRIMLHKPEIAGQPACFARTTCDAISTKTIDPGARASHSDFLSNRFYVHNKGDFYACRIAGA
jgi:hypothetical protein